MTSISREYFLSVSYFLYFELIYALNRDTWNILISKTHEIDDLNSQSRYNNYNIVLNKNFVESLNNFNSLKRFRQKRTRIHRIEKSNVITKNNN